MKNKHRIKQGLSLLLAGGLALTNLGAALPAFAADAPATPETAEAATPETAEADATAPNLVQITENLYDDLPDAPTGSYLGSMGLPVATGETKIGISAWVSDLYDGVDAHMDADALNADENTVTIGKTPGTDYAIVPLLAQVEYPADGAVSEIILPDGVELLSYRSTDYEPIPADEQEQAEILHRTYSEQSAAATGLYRAAQQLIPHNGGIFAAFHGIFQHQILAVLQFGAYRQVAQQVHLAAIIAEMFGGYALVGADKSPRSFHSGSILSFLRVNQI